MAAGAITLSACGSPNPSVIASARAAADHASAVLVTDTATVLGATSTISGFIGRSTASITWTDGALGALTITEDHAHLYVSGSTPMLAHVLHLSARAQRILGGGTVDLVAGDAPFASLKALVSLSGILTPFIATSGWSGIASLTMATASSLPSFGLLEVRNGTQHASRSAHFTNWGTTAYVVSAPPTSIPFSQIVDR